MFQDQYFGNSNLTGSNNHLLTFCREIISQLITRLNIPPNILATENIEELSQYINDNISFEDQEKFINAKTTSEDLKEIINEQKHKFGTEAFTNNFVPRIISEKVREDYKKAVQKSILGRSNLFSDLGLRLIGLGFGGAAFLVESTLNHKRIPPIVLKIPTPYYKNSYTQNFANLEDEYLALALHTKHAIQTKSYDHDLSQRLALCKSEDQPKTWLYLGQRASETNLPMLATIYHDSENIYEKARELNRKFHQKATKQVTAEFINPYISKGINRDHILEIIKWYMEKARAGLNFYDLFPHNMLYDSRTERQHFLDYASRIGEIEQGILQARKNFPVDCLVFDLFTYIILHEQKHPIAIEIRTSARITTWIEALINKTKTHNASSMTQEDKDQAYQVYIDRRFEQIKYALLQAIKDKVFTLHELRDALNRLCDVSNREKSYGEHFKFLHKDFQRILMPESKEERRGFNLLLAMRNILPSQNS